MLWPSPMVCRVSTHLNNTPDLQVSKQKEACMKHAVHSLQERDRSSGSSQQIWRSQEIDHSTWTLLSHWLKGILQYMLMTALIVTIVLLAFLSIITSGYLGDFNSHGQTKLSNAEIRLRSERTP